MKGEKSSSILGSKVSDTRKKLGLSQEALAEKAKVSLSTIQRIEKGSVKPRPYTLKILAETLKMHPEELLSVEGTNARIDESFLSLKRMNLSTLIFFFIPFVSIIVPVFFWKINKQIDSKNIVAGKIVSFQLLWSILTIVAISLTLFVSNLIIGDAGEGLYFMLIVFLFAVLFNIYIIVKTAFQLNKKDQNTLSFVPNFF